MPALTGDEVHEANFLLGPWLIGSCIDLLLQGVICSQVVNYYTYYGDDKGHLRIVVAILALLTVLKSIQAFAIIWIQFITYFGDLQAANQPHTRRWQSGNPLMVALIGLYVQTYFCYRLWAISKKAYVVVPIFVLFLFAFLAVAVATYYISTTDIPAISTWFAAHLSSTCAADIILSLTTASFLLKSKKNVLPQTVGLISALVRLTFQTAAPAALCAMFNLIFSQVYSSEVAIVSTAFNMALPKFYAISMLWTLNARRTISAAHSSRNGMTNTSNEISGARSRATRRANGDVELGPIQVLTQTETHIVRDMFDKSQPHSTHKSDDESVQYSK
ncbi:hypothetical protein B0H16DRAFT_1731233 [Mycena metata]|uniref:DUF6534 domain-containing protein n=1 Tax=Mycena metata TaxID=1033252 RepID=A0AAD7I6Z8_9AGAR|nr:hypothetical protein B0H16DRAFT_1731233 [Mycena metata]